MIYHPSQHDQESAIKQAHIKPGWAKEELKPFYTNLGTGMRATGQTPHAIPTLILVIFRTPLLPLLLLRLC